MFVYGLVNTIFDFPARYCFENDKNGKDLCLVDLCASSLGNRSSRQENIMRI